MYFEKKMDIAVKKIERKINNNSIMFYTNMSRNSAPLNKLFKKLDLSVRTFTMSRIGVSVLGWVESDRLELGWIVEFLLVLD